GDAGRRLQSFHRSRARARGGVQSPAGGVGTPEPGRTRQLPRAGRLAGIVLKIETIQALAHKARIDRKTLAALLEFVDRLSPELAALAENAALRLQGERPGLVLA